MTPKQKAVELINEFNNFLHHSDAKRCAIIAVDEILNAHLFDLDEKQYWNEVKKEIENL